MSDEKAKIRIKIGQLEIEYEGRGTFIEDGLYRLIENVIRFSGEHESVASAPSAAAPEKVMQESTSGGQLDLSTNTIAARLGVRTCTDLVIAAAAHLTLVKSQDKFSHKQILQEMKNATHYYKKNMSTNYLKSIERLEKKGILNQITEDLYTLSGSKRAELEGKLAQS